MDQKQKAEVKRILRRHRNLLNEVSRTLGHARALERLQKAVKSAQEYHRRVDALMARGWFLDLARRLAAYQMERGFPTLEEGPPLSHPIALP